MILASTSPYSDGDVEGNGVSISPLSTDMRVHVTVWPSSFQRPMARRCSVAGMKDERERESVLSLETGHGKPLVFEPYPGCLVPQEHS